MEQYECKICNKLQKSFGSLGQHYVSAHQLSKEEYWTLHYPDRKVCPTCGKFTPLRKGEKEGQYYYLDHCTMQCRKGSPLHSAKMSAVQLNMSKEARVSQLKKRRKTCLERYGHTNNWNSEYQKQRAIEIAETRTTEEWARIAEETWITKKTKTYHKLMKRDFYPVITLDDFITHEDYSKKILHKCKHCDYEEIKTIRIGNKNFGRCKKCYPIVYPKNRKTKEEIIRKRMEARLLKANQYKVIPLISIEEAMKLVNKSGTEAMINWKCKECNHKFERQFRIRKISCPKCTANISVSKGEKEILKFVEEIYKGKIIENARYIIRYTELDIYLPELKLAIEFNGSYWHSDPRFYEAGYYNKNKKKFAHELWAKDAKKIIQAKEKGIKLIQIWEHDWLTDENSIKENLQTIIKEENLCH